MDGIARFGGGDDTSRVRRCHPTAVKDAYQLDIDWVASPDELARYDRLSTDSIGAFITAFWSARDLQELRPRGSQLREHLRRWVYVKQRFPSPDLGYRALFLPYGVASCRQLAEPSASPDVASTSRQGYSAVPQLFDSRAVLYMRYGASMHPRGSDDVALRMATGDGNPALAYRYDAGLMSGGDIMSTGSGTTAPRRRCRPAWRSRPSSRRLSHRSV